MTMEADVYYDELGKDMRTEEIPADMLELAQEYRDAMIEAAASVDDDLMEKFLMEEEITKEEVEAEKTEEKPKKKTTRKKKTEEVKEEKVEE